MRKAIKLGLLTVVASVILALPVTASAEIPSRGEPLPTTTPRIDVITQVPVEIKDYHYLSTVDLLPEGGDASRTLPAIFKDGVKSIEITGPLSNLVHAYTWDSSPYNYNLNQKVIKFYSLGGAAKVTVKVTNYEGDWGYFIVNVSPPVVDHLLGTVNLHPAKGVPDSIEVTLPLSMKSVFGFGYLGPYWINSELIDNGSKIKFTTSLMSKTTMQLTVFNSDNTWGYYIINVQPIGYCLPPIS